MPASLMLQTTATSPPGFSLGIFLTLVFVCGVSGLIFWMLVQRWTSRRQWVSLSDWARENGFRTKPITRDQLPPPLATLAAGVRLSLSSPRASFVQLQSEIEASPSWNVLIRKTRGAWIPSGLRPASQTVSLMDTLGMTTYPAYSTAERFHLVSADSAAARKLSKNSARALLPADVGMLLWGEWLVLDFTQRPFDPIEFGRMLAVADQVAQAVDA